MDINILTIIYYLFLLDAFGAMVMAWSGAQRWWHEHFTAIAVHFPLARGWTTVYFVIILVVGVLLDMLGLVPTPF